MIKQPTARDNYAEQKRLALENGTAASVLKFAHGGTETAPELPAEPAKKPAKKRAAAKKKSR